MEDGDHIVLGMDVNEDVPKGFVNNKLADIGMFEGIIRNHPTKSVPATCNKDRISRRPINSIWVSPGVDVVRCRFLPYHSYKGFDSNHCMVRVEIDNTSILGHYPQCASKFLFTLEMPESIRAKGQVNCIATLEKHWDDWKAQKAHTTSKSSTLGFEHYKSAIFDPDLCKIDHLLQTAPLEVKFVPPSWLSITDVAILKKLGIFWRLT